MMVKPNEVRIGNWLLMEYLDSKYVQVTAVSDKSGIVINRAPITSSILKGIPVTPEILLKAGFYKQDENYYVHDESYIWIMLEDMTIGLFILPCENDADISVKYVHQLQNFYFALTGEELKIEL
jgi:hypothetical protein